MIQIFISECTKLFCWSIRIFISVYDNSVNQGSTLKFSQYLLFTEMLVLPFFKTKTRQHFG